MYKIKDSESSFELTIWQKEMGSNSSIEQAYLKLFILEQYDEVAVAQINVYTLGLMWTAKRTR